EPPERGCPGRGSAGRAARLGSQREAPRGCPGDGAGALRPRKDGREPDAGRRAAGPVALRAAKDDEAAGNHAAASSFTPAPKQVKRCWMKRGYAARPVLKWAGGKRQLQHRILEKLQADINTYYEPFVGGGAIFFALAAENRFKRAVLGDRNADLVDVYRALTQDVEAVIRLLRKYRYSETEYYRVREQRPRSLAARAARLIYLNKTGYNGLYRVNRAGEFNVPFGRHKSPLICDEDNLRAAAEALSRAEVVTADFEAVCRDARAGDAVYFDPPYLPLSKTSNFTAYDPHPFGVDEHERLAPVFE